MKPKINLDSKIQIEDLESNFWGFFHDKVEENSNRDLLISRFETLKVGEANHRSNVIYKKLSGGLIQKKGGVAIALVDQIKAIATLLGVWKSNNYSLALNFSNPISRLEFQLKDANIHTIITETSHVKLIKKISQPNVKIINYDNLDFEEEVQNPVIEINLDDMFQIVYTSGSTGNPKGVIGDYRYLIRSVVRKTNDTSPSDRFSLYNSFSFPGPVPMIFRSIFSGTPICYYNLQKEGLVGFSDWIRKSEITHFSLTPTLFRNFNQLLSPDESFPSVNTIKLGAEKKLREDFNRLKELFNPSAVFELSFASTETMGVSRGRYPLTHEFTSDILPAGYPLDDIEIFIWDKDQKEVAQGEEGEIVIRGDALARGYWNLPKLTKERFIPDNSSLGMRYYRSGDLGKILPDGQLMHLGRLDHMVKIKGIRIELESIENHTLTYPGITAVASKPFTDSRGIQRLVTYFIAEKDITIPISDLRMHLQERISSQMMPHFFVQVDIFPLTNSGKISTTELPIPQMTRPNLFNPYESAQNPIEEKLVEIWEDYIGIEGIGVTDDFFDVGGDSLIASLLILGIEKKLNQKYPVSLLIKAATIRDQANLIALGEKNSGLNSPLITIRKNGTLPPLFFIPGRGGHPTRIINLKEKLNKQIPIYAFQEMRRSKNDEITDDFGKKVKKYISQIKEVRPEGPYLFLGESAGGKYVYEIARQLAESGDEIPVLALLDSYHYSNSKNNTMVKMPRVNYLLGLIEKHITIFISSDKRGRIDYLKYYQSEFFFRINWLFKVFWRRIKSKLDKKYGEELEKIRKEKSLLRNKYKLAGYPGKVILFKATKGQYANVLANGWDGLKLGELKVHPLNCYHGGVLFEPAVSWVGATLNDYVVEFINNEKTKTKK